LWLVLVGKSSLLNLIFAFHNFGVWQRRGPSRLVLYTQRAAAEKN
jgi:hypothetical protein